MSDKRQEAEKPDRGVFIVIEGPNCAGKSTATDTVGNALRALGRGNIELLHDPDGAPDSCAKRTLETLLLLRTHPVHGESIDAAALAVAYTLNRRLMSRDIDALLEDGFDVVCDRWWPSTVAYQGVDEDEGGLGLDHTAALQQICDVLTPDVIIHLDLSYDEYVRRCGRRSREAPMAMVDFEMIRARYRDAYRRWRIRPPVVIHTTAWTHAHMGGRLYQLVADGYDEWQRNAQGRRWAQEHREGLRAA